VRIGRAIVGGLVLAILFFSHVQSSCCQAEPRRPIATERESAITATSSEREGLIHLDVTVRDQAAEPVSGLSAKGFTLLDNGAATKMMSFRASEHARDDYERLTEVVLVLDEVNLSSVQFELVQRETAKFLSQNGGRLVTPVSVYWFAPDGLYATARPTNDGSALANDVAHHRPPYLIWPIPPIHDHYMTPARLRGYLWEKALRTIYSITVERRDKPGRKLVVWMGFGWPVTERFEHIETTFDSIVELSTRMREARIVLYQITDWSDPENFNFDYKNFVSGIHSESELKTPSFQREPSAPLALQVLTIQSGGQVLDKSPDIVRRLEYCVRDASTFYTVSFDPPHAEQPDEYHDLKVQPGISGASAHTNSGYYDQPLFYDQPQIPIRRVGVRELGQILAEAGGKNEDKLAEQLNSIELTERIRNSLLSLWKDRLRGKNSKAALVRLADASVFLSSPADEILPNVAPDRDQQRDMLSRTAKYVDDVLLKLPDFFATRTTVQFEQRSPKETDTWKTALADQSLLEAVTEKTTLWYRNGHEEWDAQKRTGSRSAKLKDLSFIGIFGPLLNSVLADAARAGSSLTWSRWEQGDQGQEAVFNYAVRGTSPSYAVVDCCLRGGTVFRAKSEYQGELAIAPETGAVLRLTMESEPEWIVEPNLQPVRPVKATRMMVEYGPVEIGGHKYICPYRSVVMMRSRPVRPLVFWDQRFEIYAPYETLLDDIAYTDYHKFGSESRILPSLEVPPN
jgi:VWFA-related protein